MERLSSRPKRDLKSQRYENVKEDRKKKSEEKYKREKQEEHCWMWKNESPNRTWLKRKKIPLHILPRILLHDSKVPDYSRICLPH